MEKETILSKVTVHAKLDRCFLLDMAIKSKNYKYSKQLKNELVIFSFDEKDLMKYELDKVINEIYEKTNLKPSNIIIQISEDGKYYIISNVKTL